MVLLVLSEIPKSGFIEIVNCSTIDPIEPRFHICSFEININTLSTQTFDYLIKKGNLHYLQYCWKISSTHQLYQWPTFHRYTIILINQILSSISIDILLPLLEIQPMDYPIVLDIDYPIREDYQPFARYSMLM